MKGERFPTKKPILALALSALAACLLIAAPAARADTDAEDVLEAPPPALEILEEDSDGQKSCRFGELVFRTADSSLDLSGLKQAEIEMLIPTMEEMPDLKEIRLTSDEVPLETVGLLQMLPSQPLVHYPVTLYGKEFNTADESINLNRVGIKDNGAALREVLPYMTNCSMVEMEHCGLKYVTYASIRDDFPERGIVWRVSFGGYSVRTDETRILASIKGYNLTGDNCAALKYCTKVKYLDLGHNIIDDISFVAYMPDLEVAILAINYWSDASPLAACKNLEYLEIFNTRCTDLSPLAELTNLKHLNICWIKQLKDITPLYGLTGLERLWIGNVNKVPKEQLKEIRERLPNTKINTTTDNPTSEGWRKDPRYDLLAEQLGYNWKQPYSLPSGAKK